MTLTQDLSEMLEALHRAKRDLDESLSLFLDVDPLDLQSLAHLQETAGRNARSAKLIEMILQGQATGVCSGPMAQ